ncbi:MAG TPA: NAD(P)/FAD-dependent oxidoreductase [Spirochaetia bacterium]|nr:NAD(P)/FAD-dependent oxidoreductase [Spirochaetia bacterium]
MTHKDCIVVGGGIAGLTAALSLAKKGKDVLLLEKNERCGGLMNSFVRDGFRFEGGARALVNAGLVKPLIKEFGLDVEVLPNPITLGVEDKLLRIDGERSLDAYAGLLKGLYPGSADEVDRIIQAIRGIIEDMKVLYGVDSPLFSNKKRNALLLLPSVIAWMLKFFRTMHRISRMDRPFEAYLDEISSNQSLKDIIGQHFFRKTPVFFALSYFALYNDYIYPKGGVGALVQAMVDAIHAQGGEVLLDTEIQAIDARGKVLTDSGGASYGYGKMIWAGDLKSLYAMTADATIPDKDRKTFARRKDAILGHRGAESVFSVYLAADAPPEEFGKVASGHVFYTPDRRGLGTVHTAELQELLGRWDSVRKDEVYAWLRRFCRYNTFEISIPALRDPDAAPAGKTGIIISALFEYDLAEKARAAGWHEEFKSRVEEEFIDTISSSLYPGLKDKVLFSFSASPSSIRRRVGSSEGSIVGWSFEGKIPVVTSMFRMAESARTALPDVYAAGKWVYSPAGGPTAIMTGRIAAKRCLKS